MENYYQAILQKLAENTPVALETIISGEEGERKTGLSRRLTDVVPVADARGRRFARVTAEEAEGKLCRSAGLGQRAALQSVWWMTARTLPTPNAFRRRHRSFVTALKTVFAALKSPRLIMWLLLRAVIAMTQIVFAFSFRGRSLPISV